MTIPTLEKPARVRPTARELLRMTRAQRQPYLEASAAVAEPLYAADLAKPEHERQLTADLETGDIYDDQESSHA